MNHHINLAITKPKSIFTYIDLSVTTSVQSQRFNISSYNHKHDKSLDDNFYQRVQSVHMDFHIRWGCHRIDDLFEVADLADILNKMTNMKHIHIVSDFPPDLLYLISTCKIHHLTDITIECHSFFIAKSPHFNHQIRLKLSVDTTQTFDESTIDCINNPNIAIYFDAVPTSYMTKLYLLTNLVSLNVHNCSLSTISTISTLRHLTYTCSNTNGSLDISPLALLTELQQLQLKCNIIVNSHVLNTLSNLTVLTLSCKYIVNPTPISCLTNLTCLTLDIAESGTESGLALDIYHIPNLTDVCLSFDIFHLFVSTKIVNIKISSASYDMRYYKLLQNTILQQTELIAKLTARLDAVQSRLNELI